MLNKIPRSGEDDYTTDIVSQRVQFLESCTQSELNAIKNLQFEPSIFSGNIENFIGMAQIPIGVAGPLKVIGEYAVGDFYVPLATTEGTLVASYNRGMKLTAACGGIRTCILEQAMQRAPLFIFDSAVTSKKFGLWVEDNYKEIKQSSESTSRIATLMNIEQHTVGKLRWLRFNYLTGDAAGQNMVTKATREACMWILDKNPEGLQHFTLAANLDTDKKHSHLNTIHTRGKRVVAEITIPANVIEKHLHTTAKVLHYQRQLSNVGSQLSASINNGSHSANGLTALFIATGQDVANIAESSAGIIYGELCENGDYYFSVTIPSLIVATYGGGTGLPTQRECLEILSCYGTGKVEKLAEIAAALVLCGELSLSGAVVSDQWVSSHEKYGRNR